MITTQHTSQHRYIYIEVSGCVNMRYPSTLKMSRAGSSGTMAVLRLILKSMEKIEMKFYPRNPDAPTGIDTQADNRAIIDRFAALSAEAIEQEIVELNEELAQYTSTLAQNPGDAEAKEHIAEINNILQIAQRALDADKTTQDKAKSTHWSTTREGDEQ